MPANQTRLQFTVLLLLAIVLFLLSSLDWENAEGRTITVDDDGEADYQSIQDAINAAIEGDTIRVYAGTYFENVVVNRTVTLEGNDSANTIIDGERKADVILIDTDGVRMSGFTITASGGQSNRDGIVVESSENELFGNLIVNNANGIYVFGGAENSIHDNTLTGNDFGIQVVSGSDGNTISKNTCTENRKGDIILRTSKENQVRENHCASGPIYLVDADHNTVDGNQIRRGIVLELSRHNTISNNNCTGNPGDGIIVTEYCRYNTIVRNTCQDNQGSGIRMHQSLFNTVEDNICSSNGEYGILVSDTRENTLSNNECSGNGMADIALSRTTSITIEENEMAGRGLSITGELLEQWNTHIINATNTVNGKPVYFHRDSSGVTVPTGAGQVILANCSQMTVEGQNCNNVATGIAVAYSSNITIKDSDCRDNAYGLYLRNSTYLTLTGNALSTSTEAGIFLLHTDHAILTGNTLTGNGILIEASSPSGWSTHEIDDTNTVNGKPVYYYQDAADVTIPAGAGQIILAGCQRVVVENQSCGNTTVGMMLAYSSEVTVRDSSFLQNRYHGIWLFHSNHNQIANTSCLGNEEYGLFIQFSSTNTISDVICQENINGMVLSFANHSTVSGSICKFNSESGILLHGSSGNLLEDGIWFDNSNGSYLRSGSKTNVFINNTVSSNTNNGIFLDSGSNENTFTTNTISGNIVGIHLYKKCKDNTAHRNNIFTNSEYGILFTDGGSYSIDATKNWWDDESGPYHKGYNPNGKGDNISANVDFSDWLEHPLDAITPSVVSSVPAEGDGDVAVDTEVWIQFQFKMNENSVREAFSVSPYMDYGLSWDKTILILTPRKDFEYSTKYTIKVRNDARTIEGWKMEEDFVLTFTIEDRDLNPEAVFIWPMDGDDDVPVDPTIQIRFSEPMDTETVADSLEADFDFELTWDTEEPETILYMVPEEELQFGTAYSYSFFRNPTDLGGKYLIKWREVSFTTESLFVNIIEPAPWEEVSENVIISGTAPVLSDVVEIEVDDRWQVVDYFHNGYDEGQHRSGEWGFNLSTRELENGEQRFKLRCRAGDQVSDIQQLALIVVNNDPPEIRSFELNRDSYRKGDTISVSASIFDPDGIDTLESITLELRKESGKLIDKELITSSEGGAISYEYTLPDDLEDGTYKLVLVVKDSSGTLGRQTVEFGVGTGGGDDGENDGFRIAGMNGVVVAAGVVGLVCVLGTLVFVVLPRFQEEEDEEDEDDRRSPEDSEDDDGKHTTRKRKTVTPVQKPSAATAVTTAPKTVTCPRCGDDAFFVPERERYRCDNCDVYIKATIKKISKTKQKTPKAMCPNCKQIGVYSAEHKCYYCGPCDSYFGGL